MIICGAVVPAAPMLLEEVNPSPPPEVREVTAAIRAALDALAPHDLGVLIAAAPGQPGPGQGVYGTAHIDLAGMGRGDITATLDVPAAVAEALTRLTQYPMYRGDFLPPALAVLALWRRSTPVVPLSVPGGASFESLVAVGAALAEALAESGNRVAVIVSGDLASGLGDRSPLAAVEGATEWDEQLVALAASGRLDGLEHLGPQEARRVGALGWAPLSALHGVCARAGLGVRFRHYSAPRGVGYLVADVTPDSPR